MITNRYFALVCLCLAAVILLSGCSSSRSNQKLAAAAASREQIEQELKEKPYIVGIDDTVRIYVPYDPERFDIRHYPELEGEYVVGGEGEIFMPLIGEVQAAGLTKAELQKSITEKLSKFIINPEVNVGITQYRSKKVYVIGEVLRPGPVPIRGNILTVWDAIVEAGLPLRTAALWRVHVITPDVENPVEKRINLRGIMYGGKFAHNDFLKPGDIVVVPSTVAVSLGSYLGQIVTPATDARSLATVYEFFKNRSYFLDPLYGRYGGSGL